MDSESAASPSDTKLQIALRVDTFKVYLHDCTQIIFKLYSPPEELVLMLAEER